MQTSSSKFKVDVKNFCCDYPANIYLFKVKNFLNIYLIKLSFIITTPFVSIVDIEHVNVSWVSEFTHFLIKVYRQQRKLSSFTLAFLELYFDQFCLLSYF